MPSSPCFNDAVELYVRATDRVGSSTEEADYSLTGVLVDFVDHDTPLEVESDGLAGTCARATS